MTTKQNLREKTQKLKTVIDNMTEEIAKQNEELSTLQQTISRCDIELSLIHDAFGLRFGTISDAQRNQALEAMENLLEVENLQIVLQREQSQVKWLQGEVSRLQGLVPEKMLEDVDLQDLETRKQKLDEKYQALQKKNIKKEKNIKNAENQIKAMRAEIDKLQEDLEIKEEENKEASQIFEQAEQLASENAELTDSLSQANKEIEQIQKYIDENGNAIKESAQYQDDIDSLREKMEKANQPFYELKEKYESFMKGINPLQENMSNQLDEITRLIEKLEGLNC